MDICLEENDVDEQSVNELPRPGAIHYCIPQGIETSEENTRKHFITEKLNNHYKFLKVKETEPSFLVVCRRLLDFARVPS